MLKIEKETDTKIEVKIKKLIDELKKYDDGKKYLVEKNQELGRFRDKLISIGRPAVPQLIKLLNARGRLSYFLAVEALGEICEKRAIIPLMDTLEELELGNHAKNALIKYGPEIIPEVIKKLEYRIAHPIKREFFNEMTQYPLTIIGEIKCDESIKFLNELLDDYLTEMKVIKPKVSFDPSKINWKYRNLNIFHLLDCLVRQQDKSAIPHIRKLRDFFPTYYVDHKICQIAINRIKKGKVEGYLPMEAVEMAFPSELIMKVFGRKLGLYDDDDEDF